MNLKHDFDFSVTPFAQPFLGGLNLQLSNDDGMYRGNDSHYLSCGASALSVILASLHLSGSAAPQSLLDFGAGAGRVTRWLRAAFPETSIDTCDLRSQDMTFCAETFGTNSWISGVDIEALHAPKRYDLIWLGSVFTHLPAEKTECLLRKIASWLNAGGLLVASFHGRFALERQGSGEFRYIHDEGWMRIEAGYEERGYGYSDYEGQSGYGISVTKLSWLASFVESNRDMRLITLSEKVWDGHHDVIAIKNMRQA